MPKTRYVTDWSQVPLVIDVPYVAVLLELHPATVKKYLRGGKLKGFKVGCDWRITKNALAQFMGLEVI